MPPFGWRLNDQQVADVVNFIRTSWGNSAKPVSASDVADVRKDRSMIATRWAAPGANPDANRLKKGPPPGEGCSNGLLKITSRHIGSGLILESA